MPSDPANQKAKTMSNSKVRARRRRRANKAWTKACEPQVYTVVPWVRFGLLGHTPDSHVIRYGFADTGRTYFSKPNVRTL